jgi:Ca2+-binding EF-hand superfamily protein
MERLTDALAALGHNTSKDSRYPEFLLEHTANESNEGPSDQLDFEHFALIVLEYEEQLRVETEALRRLDLKVAFECFDMNKGRWVRHPHQDRLVVYADGMIDAEELSSVMMQLGCSINDREAKDMIEFADQDQGTPSLVDRHISLSLSL